MRVNCKTLSHRGNLAGVRTPVCVCVLVLFLYSASPAQIPEYRIADFREEITIPLNHRCMGVLPVKSRSVADPLEAHGLVLTGMAKPVALVALDWCEVRNGSYDAWRSAIAKAAGTTPERVLLCCLHQHDAPVTDIDAQRYLDQVGLEKELFDPDFEKTCIKRVAAAVEKALVDARPVTHVGIGQAVVHDIASNRRVAGPDGKVDYSRGSRSGGVRFHADAPRGEIDPQLKTLSFWSDDRPLAALHAYATHPMSHYGRGEVSADFVGIARRRFQAVHPKVKQIYVSGCSGDVTAGKYNDGAPARRGVLADRLLNGMTQSWQATQRRKLNAVAFRRTHLLIPYSSNPNLHRDSLLATLHDDSVKTEKRILAAMSLSSLDRVEQGAPIDFPCLDFGAAKLILFPAEAFVGYQLLAQRMDPDCFVVSIGYGECWPGYIPTTRAFEDDFKDTWLWSDRGSEAVIRQGLEDLLGKGGGRK